MRVDFNMQNALNKQSVQNNSSRYSALRAAANNSTMNDSVSFSAKRKNDKEGLNQESADKLFSRYFAKTMEGLAGLTAILLLVSCTSLNAPRTKESDDYTYPARTSIMNRSDRGDRDDYWEWSNSDSDVNVNTDSDSLSDETKPDDKPDYKPDSKPDHKPDSKPDYKPDRKPDRKPGSKPDSSSESEQTQSETDTPEPNSDGGNQGHDADGVFGPDEE